MRQCEGVCTIPDAELGAPDIIIELTQTLLAFVNSFIVIKAADQGQIIAKLTITVLR